MMSSHQRGERTQRIRHRKKSEALAGFTRMTHRLHRNPEQKRNQHSLHLSLSRSIIDKSLKREARISKNCTAYHPPINPSKEMPSLRSSSRATFLLFILAPPSIESFAPPNHPYRIRQWRNPNASSSKRYRRVTYHNGRKEFFDARRHDIWLLNSNDDEGENDQPAESPSRRPSNKDANDDDAQEGIGQKVGFGILSTFGYALQLASWLISAGLVLNIFGYGYEFDREAQYGVKIDTLKNIRQENQMRNEFARLGKQKGASPDPLRSLQEQQQQALNDK